ncbi:MAG: hypothetical protein JO193_09075, partial [Candidatus Eremiobacteraeota bacterium]|nr:hypothetical protein [Candidatus Eremiobacteraeota bacterium]
MPPATRGDDFSKYDIVLRLSGAGVPVTFTASNGELHAKPGRKLGRAQQNELQATMIRMFRLDEDFSS